LHADCRNAKLCEECQHLPPSILAVGESSFRGILGEVEVLRFDNVTNFRHNHYVPVWFQKRFMNPGESKYYRLDRKPDPIRNTGENLFRYEIHHWSPKRIFVEDDLYTTRLGQNINIDIEKFFFGQIDNEGKSAVEYMADLGYPDYNGRLFEQFMEFMSVQKLRTPKGIEWLRRISPRRDSNSILQLLQQIRNIFCANWTECIWQFASAERSATKFIISDHPVTVYNRACPPGSSACVWPLDPDIRCHASHTFLPLSQEKIVILTNLSWVRNPHQKETRLRPNPDYFRNTIFNFQDIQFDRQLSEEEVVTINYITKQRSSRYVAGAKKVAVS